MDKLIANLVHELYLSMVQKLALVWSQRGGWFPPEANIEFELERLGKRPDFDYYAYGQCDIGTKQRADMILVNSTDQWICHVECKLVNTDTCKDGRVIADLRRVADPSGLTYFLNKVNSAPGAHGLRNSNKFGLYIGADISWMYQWWVAALGNQAAQANFMQQFPHDDSTSKQSLIDGLSCFARNINWEVEPRIPASGKYWIVYGLFKLP